jgi:hypothetical protein
MKIAMKSNYQSTAWGGGDGGGKMKEVILVGKS